MEGRESNENDSQTKYSPKSPPEKSTENPSRIRTEGVLDITSQPTMAEQQTTEAACDKNLQQRTSSTAGQTPGNREILVGAGIIKTKSGITLTEQKVRTDEKPITKVTSSNASTVNTADSGNDRVTLDKLNLPLVPRDFSKRSETEANYLTVSKTTQSSGMKSIPLKGSETKPPGTTSAPTKNATPKISKDCSDINNPAPAGSTICTQQQTSFDAKDRSAELTTDDQLSIIEEAIKKERTPLTDKYGSYIIPSDTTLEEARSRLRTAIEQTRQLRSAFTERVYGKYRVCLRPPQTTEEIFTRILTEPDTSNAQLEQEIKQLKEEKDIEKKEAQKLNAEMMAATNNGEGNPLTAMNAENAEQLMFISAGLSLILLPEQDVTGIDMSAYSDRSPTNPETGQRVRSISAAAAAAGEVMLDRARKGSAMRLERIRRKQLQLLSGDDSAEADNNYSRLSLLSCSAAAVVPPPPPKPAIPVGKTTLPPPAITTVATKPVASPLPTNTVTKSVKRPTTPKPTTSTAPSPNTKAIRARVQASMSVQTLLSLSPSAEELRTDGKISAATIALMERGVGTHGQNAKFNQQQRYRHPFPDSRGGRRRALQSAKKDPNSPPDLYLTPSNLAMTLPPVPTPRERRSKKRMPVLEPSAAASTRAKGAIKRVLDQFVAPQHKGFDHNDSFTRPNKRRITEIGFLHGVHRFVEDVKEKSVDTLDDGSAELRTSIVDPILAFNVLQAVGLIKPSTGEENVAKGAFPTVLETSMFDVAEKRAMGEDGGQSRRSIEALRALHGQFGARKYSISDTFDDTSMDEFCVKKASGIDDLEKTGVLEESQVKENQSFPDKAQVMPIKSDASFGKNENNVHNLKSTQIVTAVSIRGGGEELTDSSESSGSKGNKGQQQRNGTSPQSGGVKPGEATDSSNRIEQTDQSSIALNGPPSYPQAGAHPMVWDDPSRQSLVLLNPQMAGGHPATLLQHANGAANMARNQHMQVPSAEHYHPHATNAFQLANQLRLSRMQPPGHHGAGDLVDYIGGLHSQPSAGYDWQSIGAAAVASTHSLAALGLNPHRAAMVNFSVQDRARALLVRDQQTAAAAAAAHAAAAHRQQQAVAFLGGGGSHLYAPQHFTHMGGPTTTGRLLNSPALVGHTGMNSQVPPPGQPQPAAIHPQSAFPGMAPEPPLKKPPKDLRSEHTKKDQKRESSKDSPKSEGMLETGSDDGGFKNDAPSNKKRKNSEQDETEVNRRKRVNIVENGPYSQEADTSKSNPGACHSSGPSVAAAAEPSCVRIEGNVRFKEQPAAVAEGIVQATSPFSQSSVVPDEGKVANKTEDSAYPSSLADDAMQFFVPPAPPALSAEIASHVLSARIHEGIELISSADAPEASSLVEYLFAVGAAVPIPKALVANPFKDKINLATLKCSALGSIPPTSRELVIASVLLWLWRNHEKEFQRAFAKSGRIDVDPECKWLIVAAVEKSVQALRQGIAGATIPGTPLTGTLMTNKKLSSSQKTNQSADSDRPQATTKLDILFASIVSKALASGLVLDEEMDAVIPNFHKLLSYLDECRKSVLHSKSQERALLAALVSRKATMSLPFSHAYVSSMVRAGEALGHGELFEVVQNEEVNVSTMIPYDVFTDESGAWEDPCRPIQGFTSNLTGDDLMRRAHARAMIQKSLKKLQDRHNVKGGTPTSGAYTDPTGAVSGTNSDSGRSVSSSTATTPRGWLKRRSSFSEPPVQPGTGSAAATSWSLYDPRHYSAPLEWKSDAVENSPYGRHNKDARPRTLSTMQQPRKKWGKDARGKTSGRSVSLSAYDHAGVQETGRLLQSTQEIAWADVAGIFQNVTLSSNTQGQKDKDPHSTPRGATIFAPFVRKIDLPSDEYDSEVSDDEDLGDEIVLSRHQFVLDRMKEKLSAFLETRKKTQERRKNRSSKPK